MLILYAVMCCALCFFSCNGPKGTSRCVFMFLDVWPCTWNSEEQWHTSRNTASSLFLDVPSIPLFVQEPYHTESKFHAVCFFKFRIHWQGLLRGLLCNAATNIDACNARLYADLSVHDLTALDPLQFSWGCVYINVTMCQFLLE